MAPQADWGNQPCQHIVPGPGAGIETLTASLVDKYPTVLRVSWKTATASVGNVRFGLTPQLERHTLDSLSPALTHQGVLLGLPAAMEIYFRVEARLPTGLCYSALGTFKTGNLAPELVLLTPGANLKGQPSRGFTVAPLLQPNAGWAVILDNEGRYVWWHKLKLAALRTRLSVDRKAVLAHVDAEWSTNLGTIIRIPLDGSPQQETKVPGSHTDFVEFEPDKYAVLGRTVRTFQGGTRKLVSETIMEVPRGGQAKEVWNAFDHFTPDLTVQYGKGSYNPDPEAEAWSHFNSISYNAKDKAYMLTARNLDMVIKVPRDTFKVAWVLGGTQSSFDLGVDKDEVELPHSAQLLESSVLVFNNGSLQPGNCSRAVELLLSGAKASKVWSHNPAACHQIGALGDATRLPNGNTLVNWSTAGLMEEVTLSGELVWSVQAAMGAGFGFIDRVTSLY